jgi:uncharacterized protein YeaO (DUF488 family)
MVKTKRVYDAASKADGLRVLIDRLWPRGLKKEKAGIDLWLKDIAPSSELRKWFGHDPARWEEFVRRYSWELDNNGRSIAVLAARARRGPVTLLYAARDEEYNNGLALKAYLDRKILGVVSPGTSG